MQQLEPAAFDAAAQPVRRFVEFALGRARLVRLDLLARMGQVRLADQAPHLRVDRVGPQDLLGQAGSLLERAGGERNLHRFLQQRNVIGEVLARGIEPLAGTRQIAALACVAHQTQVGGFVGRVELQALRQPVQRMHAQLAFRAVVRMFVSQPAQDQRRAARTLRRFAQRGNQLQPVRLGLVGALLQLSGERQRPFLLGHRQGREGGTNRIQPLRCVWQQAQAQRSRHAGIERAPVAQQRVEQRVRRWRTHTRTHTRLRHQFQHQRSLRLRAALEIEHQRAAGVVELAQAGQPFGARQQANPNRLGQRFERPALGHMRQSGRCLLRVRGAQRQGLEQRAQVAVRRAERNRLQRLRERGLVAAGAKRRPRRGAVAHEVFRHAGEQMVGRHQHRRCKLAACLLARRFGQLVELGQQAQCVFDLPALDQPAHVGPVEQRHGAGLGTGAPQRQCLLDHVLGRKLPGPAGIGGGKAFEPRRAPLALEQVFEVLDRVLEAPGRERGFSAAGRPGAGVGAGRPGATGLRFLVARHQQKSG